MPRIQSRTTTTKTTALRLDALASLSFLSLVLATQMSQQLDAARAIQARQPQRVSELGPLKIETYYNSTKLNDKLRLSKWHFKHVLNIDLLPWAMKPTFKLSGLEELVRCETLSLARLEMRSLVECKPLETHVLEAKNQQLQAESTRPSQANYVRRRSLRTKYSNVNWLVSPLTNNFKLYPLQRDFIYDNLRRILVANNLTSLDFTAEPGSEFVDGFYFEASMHGEIECLGNVFVAINQTMPFVEPPFDPQDPYPVHKAHMDHLWDEMMKNGALISMQDTSCNNRLMGPDHTLESEFTLIYRKQFPYVTFNHKITSQPFNGLWNYVSQITQTRDQDGPKQAYNTTVRIDSTSVWSVLNLKFNQTFALSEDPNVAHMQSLWVIPGWSGFQENDWTSQLVSSFMELYQVQPGGEVRSPIAIAHFKEQLTDENVVLTLFLKLKRSLFSGLFEEFVRIWQPSDARRRVSNPPEEKGNSAHVEL